MTDSRSERGRLQNSALPSNQASDSIGEMSNSNLTDLRRLAVRRELAHVRTHSLA